jgi:hypothetical protein
MPTTTPTTTAPLLLDEGDDRFVPPEHASTVLRVSLGDLARAREVRRASRVGCQ